MASCLESAFAQSKHTLYFRLSCMFIASPWLSASRPDFPAIRESTTGRRHCQSSDVYQYQPFVIPLPPPSPRTIHNTTPFSSRARSLFLSVSAVPLFKRKKNKKQKEWTGAQLRTLYCVLCEVVVLVVLVLVQTRETLRQFAVLSQCPVFITLRPWH